MPEVWDYLRHVNVDGEAWECGVYKGHTSHFLANVIRDGLTYRTCRLFDTFCGRPPKGLHDTGASDTDFADTSLQQVQQRVGCHPFVVYHEGVIPQTFKGLEASRIAFAYVDLDMYQPTHDALSFILPRLVPGGIIIVDDYLAERMWPGTRRAVNELVPIEARSIDGERVVVSN